MCIVLVIKIIIFCFLALNYKEKEKKIFDYLRNILYLFLSFNIMSENFGQDVI